MAVALVLLPTICTSLWPLSAQELSVGQSLTGSGRALESLPTYSADPRDYGVDQFWLATAYTSYLWKEGGSAYGVTQAATDADTIGRIDSVAGPHHITATTGTTDRPTLASDATRLSSIRWTRASSQKLDVYNSKGSFRFLHDAPFSIFMFVKFATNGTRQYIIDTSGDAQGTGNYGLRFFKNSDNTFWIDLYGGAAAAYTSQWNVPTDTIADTNWHSILITLDAIPGTMRFQLDNNTVRTNSVVATNHVASNVDSVSDLRIGADVLGAGHYFDGYLSDLVIENSVLSAGNVTSLKAYNPARASTSLNRYTALTIANPATEMSPPPYVWYDMGDTTGMYQTNTTASAVTTDGQTIGRLESKGGAPGNRHASQATAGRRPLYKTGIQNGRSAALYDGDSGTGGASDDLSFTAWTRGKLTYYMVARSTVPTSMSGTGHEGSHLLSHGAGTLLYSFWTGPGYTTPNRLGQHLGSAYTVTMGLTDQVTQATHLLCVIRNGVTASCYVDGTLYETRSDLPSTAGFSPTHMGEQAFTTIEGGAGGWWDLKGYVEEVLFFNTSHSTTERLKMESYARSKWGTP